MYKSPILGINFIIILIQIIPVRRKNVEKRKPTALKEENKRKLNIMIEKQKRC